MSDENISGEITDANTHVRNKIIWTLKHYNDISPAMLQVGIGTSMPPALWRPAIAKMIDEGLMEERVTTAISFSGRLQSLTRYHLNVEKLPKA